MVNQTLVRQPQLSDDQIRTLAFFSIGVASEGSSALAAAQQVLVTSDQIGIRL